MSLFAGQDREAMRTAWRTAWGRHLQRLPLSPLQAHMAEVIALHPAYHPQVLPSADPAADEDSEAASRAFLHLGLHLALREQVATDRPRGIARVYQRLSAR